MSSWELTNTYMSLAFLITSIALYLGGGGMTLVPPVKLVIGNMHHRGMEFGGAHVWKMSHPQAMEFFHTQKLGPPGEIPSAPSHIRCSKTSLSSKCYVQKKDVPPEVDTHFVLLSHGYQLQLLTNYVKSP